MGNFSTTSNDEVAILHKSNQYKQTIQHTFYGECDLYMSGTTALACKRIVMDRSEDFKPTYGF